MPCHPDRRRPPFVLLVVLGITLVPVPAFGQEATDPDAARRMQASGGDRVTGAAAVLEALDAYTGHWRSEPKTDDQGAAFHFEYEFEWMDEGETVADMLITQVMADGSTNVVFEGVKGREPDGSGVYYWAVSPSGRASRGRVLLERDRLIMLYDGWTADGSMVEIRDEFMPVEGDTFTSRTHLRSSSEGEWRQIGEDRWRRSEAGGADRGLGVWERGRGAWRLLWVTALPLDRRGHTG